MFDHSHISSLARTPNANTHFVTGGPRLEAQWLDEAYAKARSLETDAMTAPGFRVVWWRGDELGWFDLVAQPRAYAVVGRHMKCDLVLPSDPSVALRHLLLRASTLEDGTLALRVLDLRTRTGFHLDDDVEQRALVTTGALALRLGRYALVALPSGAGLPELRPAADVIDAPRMPTHGGTRRNRTSVTTLPPLPMLEDVQRDVASPGHARVTLRRGGAWAAVDLPDVALEAGVLVGRAERCEPHLRAVLTESVSRVHVLLLREHGVVHAFDCASTQGLFADGERVRRVRLPDEGGTLRLASKDPVVFEWHPRAALT